MLTPVNTAEKWFLLSNVWITTSNYQLVFGKKWEIVKKMTDFSKISNVAIRNNMKYKTFLSKTRWCDSCSFQDCVA